MIDHFIIILKMENIDLKFGYGLVLAIATSALGYIAYKRQK